MTTFQDLIQSDPEVAANMLIDALRFAVNLAVPKMTMTDAEFRTIMPLALATLAGGGSEGEGEGTGEGEPQKPVG